MERKCSANLQRWIRKCLRKEFQSAIEESLEADEESAEIVEKIVKSRRMSALLDSMKSLIIIDDDCASAAGNSSGDVQSRPNTSMSFASDISASDWDAKENGDDFSVIMENISCDNPVHVRLAGYEVLLNSDLANIGESSCWNALRKTLLDGIIDESRPIFEASLQVHAKLLHYSQTFDSFSNLLAAFDPQYYCAKLRESLPTFISGINSRIFLHEKLFRIMHLIVSYQEETLKTPRSNERTMEDILEIFIAFLSTHSFGNGIHEKTLNTLNILSVLEPEANWCKKWMHALSTRKMLVSALAKSPSLLHRAIECVQKGIHELTVSTSLSISKEATDICISGDTLQSTTFLHCLTVLSHLCKYDAGRTLLSESTAEDEFLLPNFIIDLFRFLDKLSSLETSHGFYSVCLEALARVLSTSRVLYDDRLYKVALSSLSSCIKSDINIYPHTIEVLMHMLSTVDGSVYMITEQKENPMDHPPSYPAANIVRHIANLLKQPISLMDTEYMFHIFRLVEKLFVVCNSYEATHDVVENDLYSALSLFYSKMDKYHIENETKTEQIDRAIKNVLLKIASIPLALIALSRESLIMEELIRGLITPLRTCWTIEIASFVTSATTFDFGNEVIANLAPHVLTTLLSDVCKMVEDPENFYDPWDNESTVEFLHLLGLFSLNLKCLTAFVDITDGPNAEENNPPRNLYQLLRTSVDCDSVYHYLGLLSLNTFLWNLDNYLYLSHLLNFQNELLDFQKRHLVANEMEEQQADVYIVDECSFLRNRILHNSYNIRHKYKELSTVPEDCRISLTFEPLEMIYDATAEDDGSLESDSELESFLNESKPGLRDSGWVDQVRELHKASKRPMKDFLLINLLEQMQKAIPTADWVDCFKWQVDVPRDKDFWFPEDWHGIHLTLRYAQQCRSMDNTEELQTKLDEFFQASYAFVTYDKPNKFEGFDWFLSTVFIVCNGDIDQCKSFVGQFLWFPSCVYVWPTLAKVIDRNNNEDGLTQHVFSHLLETVISTELPHVKYALWSTFGVNWWQICNTMISQCFWGILPWSEIMNFLTMCILYSADYVLYYCVSLLYHCQTSLMIDITNGRMWPDCMVLDDFRCRDYIPFMDILGKRHGNKVLAVLTLKKFSPSDEM